MDSIWGNYLISVGRNGLEALFLTNSLEIEKEDEFTFNLSEHGSRLSIQQMSLSRIFLQSYKRLHVKVGTKCMQLTCLRN